MTIHSTETTSDYIVINLTGANGAGMATLVSRSKAHLVEGHSWHLATGGYANSKKAAKMHHLVIGPRPAWVPGDWVPDHISRNKLDNRDENLRWVPRSFNAWNAAKPNKHTKYRGVDRHKGKWRARLMQKCMGNHNDDRVAGRIAAKAAIKKWGEWAATSDFILGPGLFSAEEVQAMKDEIANEDPDVVSTRMLPMGVTETKYGRFRAIYRGLFLGTFDTPEEAGSAYQAARAQRGAQLWKEHLAKPITQDDEGRAVIALSGNAGEGKATKVPTQLWHQLTFNCSWNLGNNNSVLATWKGKTTPLHQLVYRLSNPDYDGESDILHISTDILDNRLENLRLRARNSQRATPV